VLPREAFTLDINNEIMNQSRREAKEFRKLSLPYGAAEKSKMKRIPL